MTRASLVLALALLASGCRSLDRNAWIPAGTARITEVATSHRQWTGLAIAGDGRIFVCFPRWSEKLDFSLGVIAPDGSVQPYPNDEVNSWTPDLDPADHFVCVQALWADDDGRLWVLDTGNPRFEGVVPEGAKLTVIDLSTNQFERVYRFRNRVAPRDSYLNDVRLDPEHHLAYITDSGLGALVVLDLESGDARRVLDGHDSTQSEDITLVVDSREWLIDGKPPRVHSDGLAIDHGQTFLYFQALTGRSLYRVPTETFPPGLVSDDDLGGSVTFRAKTGPSDGLIGGPDGAIYITSLEQNAIRRFWPDKDDIETVVQDPRISWPDSFAIGPDNKLYFTTAQIHRGPNPSEPYRIFRIDP